MWCDLGCLWFIYTTTWISTLIVSVFFLLIPSFLESLSIVGALKRRWWLRIMGSSYGFFNFRLSASTKPNFQLSMNAKVASQEALVNLSDNKGRLPNLVLLELDPESFFSSCSRCHPQKLKSLRGSLKVLELDSDYWPFFHKTSLWSNSRSRCSILRRDGGLEVLSKILKLGPSYQPGSIWLRWHQTHCCPSVLCSKSLQMEYVWGR